eukprot:GHVT01075731.1.p1 GENE.GHVT01075731.1~~GHVT01075731.1.p1  ORF type:complete len:621 (-),score=97.11 GHVT01075731.1:654-2516(-)
MSLRGVAACIFRPPPFCVCWRLPRVCFVLQSSLLLALGDLFADMDDRRQRGYREQNAEHFIACVRRVNEAFSDAAHQQDAHEFFNFLINDLADSVTQQQQQQRRMSGARSDVAGGLLSSSASVAASASLPGRNSSARGSTAETTKPSEAWLTFPEFCRRSEEDKSRSALTVTPPTSWVHQLLGGSFWSETRCLCCEAVTGRREAFFDISIDVLGESSLQEVLLNFDRAELLQAGDKYYCDGCCSYQEAERRVRLECVPPLLAIHLKRFKVIAQPEGVGNLLVTRMVRLKDHFFFPLFLTVQCGIDGLDSQHYELMAVVVHVGTSMSYGHYVCCVKKSSGRWSLLDDHLVSALRPEEITNFHGGTEARPGHHSMCGYLLFYSQIPSNGERNSSSSTPSSSAAPRRGVPPSTESSTSSPSPAADKFGGAALGRGPAGNPSRRQSAQGGSMACHADQPCSKAPHAEDQQVYVHRNLHEATQTTATAKQTVEDHFARKGQTRTSPKRTDAPTAGDVSYQMSQLYEYLADKTSVDSFTGLLIPRHLHLHHHRHHGVPDHHEFFRSFPAPPKACGAFPAPVYHPFWPANAAGCRRSIAYGGRIGLRRASGTIPFSSQVSSSVFVFC